MNEQERQALYDEYEAYALSFARSRYRIPRHLAGVLSMDDVEQHARIGLYTASQKYDPEGLHRGRAFRTVATFAIQKEIRRALQLDTIEDQPTQPNIVLLPLSPLEPPSWLIEDRYKTQEMPSLEPSVEQQVIALVDDAQVSATLEAAMLLLTEKQRIIIERRYGLTGDGVCWTLEEVGKLFETGRNKSSVKRQQDRALNVLRRELTQSSDGVVELRSLFERRARQKRAA